MGTPLYTLLPSVESVTLTVENRRIIYQPEVHVLHCFYACTSDRLHLLATWTDSAGAFMHVDVIPLRVVQASDSGTYRSPEATDEHDHDHDDSPVTMHDAIRRLWRTTSSIVHNTMADWYVVVCRLGVFAQQEHAAWVDEFKLRPPRNVLSLSLTNSRVLPHITAVSPASKDRTAALHTAMYGSLCSAALMSSVATDPALVILSLFHHIPPQNTSDRHALLAGDPPTILHTLVQQYHALSWLTMDLGGDTNSGRLSSLPAPVLVLARLAKLLQQSA